MPSHPVQIQSVRRRSFSYASPTATFAPQHRLRQNAMMPTETQLPEVRQASAQNTIFALLCGGFVVNGIVITFIAPILPIFMAKWGLDDGRAGLFSLVQFSASLVASWARAFWFRAKVSNLLSFWVSRCWERASRF